MPLTPEERQFLDAYVYEATHGPPFGGPATRSLSQKGIGYLHLSWILTAYQRELAAEGKPAAGSQNPDPPPSPWENLERVNQRNQALKEELEGRSPVERSRPIEDSFSLEEAERIATTERDGRPLNDILRDLESLGNRECGTP